MPNMDKKTGDKAETQMRRRPMRRRKKVCIFCADQSRDMYLSVVRFFLEESQVTVQSIREHLQ